MSNFTTSYTKVLKGTSEGFTLYFHSIGECRFVKGNMLKVFEYIFNHCNMNKSRKIQFTKIEKRELMYITGQKLGNVRDRIIYPLEKLGLIKFYKGEWCIELASSPSLRSNPYLLLTKLERQIFKYYSSKPGTSDNSLLQFLDIIKKQLSLNNIEPLVNRLFNSPPDSETKDILNTYSKLLDNLADSVGIKTRISDKWLEAIINKIVSSNKEVESIKVLGQDYLNKDILDWEINNFAEYFIFQHQQITRRIYTGVAAELYNDIEFVYKWNEGKVNHNRVLKDYIDLFFKRCKDNPKLTPNSALFANKKNCEILDHMYEIRSRKKNNINDLN
ncbi:hypothetical protein COJ92_16030 [Priestia megaterium]|uniref:hypothetical protein n=1 Tax=Priestia megaterium TaxID=1404 RepID=UPI000BF7A106|nr:hypothetical protein [Priestia megaterium]PFP17752.1 hypothetical protein COJ92_16030 [Priestia megaterium]